MTALTAIFSIEQGAHLGGIGPIISCGSRFVPLSMRSTRSGVGGTIGKPSLSFSLQKPIIDRFPAVFDFDEVGGEIHE